MLPWIFQHLTEIPTLLIWVTGIVLSIIYRWRNPKKFILTLIACSLFLFQNIAGGLSVDWWNSQALNPSMNRSESYATFQATQTILTIIWLLAWGILLYAIFNSKINPTELVKGSETEIHKRKKKTWIFLLIAFIFSIPAFACGTIILPILNQCQDIIPYRRNVNVAPLMDLAIPPDMDLSLWANEDVGYGWKGVTTNIERFPNIDAASDEFTEQCEYAHFRPHIKYGGQGDNRYCISSIDTERADPEGLCIPQGDYFSYVIIQKSDVIIEIFEDSSDRNSTEKNVVIVQLAEEIYQASIK